MHVKYHLSEMQRSRISRNPMKQKIQIPTPPWLLAIRDINARSKITCYLTIAGKTVKDTKPEVFPSYEEHFKECDRNSNPASRETRCEKMRSREGERT